MKRKINLPKGKEYHRKHTLFLCNKKITALIPFGKSLFSNLLIASSLVMVVISFVFCFVLSYGFIIHGFRVFVNTFFAFF